MKISEPGRALRAIFLGPVVPHNTPSVEWGRSLGQTPYGLCREDTQGLCGRWFSEESLIGRLPTRPWMTGLKRSPEI